MDTDVAVIGGGQAGLATAHELLRRGREPLVLDASAAPGQAWRERWDSLRLFTPARYCALPGLAFPADPGHLPGKDEVADYLAAYALTFGLPVRHRARVTSLVRAAGGFRLTIPGGDVTARAVVVATGAFQAPAVPALAAHLSRGVVQLHTQDYRRPSQLPEGGTVLVVGGGSSGTQVAEELAGHADVHLARSGRESYLPQRLLGRDIVEWLVPIGAMRLHGESRLGRRVRHGQQVIGSSPGRLRRAGVRLRPRLTAAVGSGVGFEDGTRLHVDAVVWATGFRADHSFIQVAGALGPDGALRHRAGVSPVPGLWCVGMPWQTSRGSALLGFVGRDAAAVADQVRSHLHVSGAPERGRTTTTHPRRTVS